MDRKEVSDQELKIVINDFIDQGHVENIVAMFRRYPQYYAWTGDLLRDERMSVRLGISVLFEELKQLQPEMLNLAVPSVIPLLEATNPLLRGEAISLLGIIATPEAFRAIRNHRDETDTQVLEMISLVLEDDR